MGTDRSKSRYGLAVKTMASVAFMGNLKTDYRNVDLSRQKLYNVDFSNQDLSRLKIRQSLCYHCNFDNANLSEADCEATEFLGSTFRGTNCYRTNFKDAKLAATVFEPKDAFGITVTLQCKTFDQIKMSELWFYGWLIFATMMRPGNIQTQEELLNKLIAMIGAERYVKLKGLFSKREL